MSVENLHLELGSDEREGEAKDEESGKADSNRDLAGGARGEGDCLRCKNISMEKSRGQRAVFQGVAFGLQWLVYLRD